MKILAIPNAHALAHVSRLLEISKILRKNGHDIVFAGFGKFLQIAKDSGFTVEQLPYLTISQIIEAVRSNRLNKLYRMSDLEKFIEAEISLIQHLNPDLVMIDNRPTARTSADYCGINTAAVLNVHMSQYRKFPFFSPGEILKPLEMFDGIATKLECILYNTLIMNDLNKFRKKMGLISYYSYQHEEGNLSLFPDIPEFNPVTTLPLHAHYVGPITWHNTLPAPSCLSKLDKNRKTIYVSLGSESLDELVDELEVLVPLGVQIIVASGSKELANKGEISPHVYVEEYVNTDKLLPECDLVCCHGGNGTLYQALQFGLPIVAVATHAEQYFGAKRIETLGLGSALKLSYLKNHGIKELTHKIHHILKDNAFQKRAESFSQNLKTWHGASNAAHLLEKIS